MPSLAKKLIKFITCTSKIPESEEPSDKEYQFEESSPSQNTLSLPDNNKADTVCIVAKVCTKSTTIQALNESSNDSGSNNSSPVHTLFSTTPSDMDHYTTRSFVPYDYDDDDDDEGHGCIGWLCASGFDDYD